MARLIRTEKEVEGRYEEVWLVVEEDALEQWPAGPREVVGRPATRVTGPLRARGEARYTADIKLPGMLHAAVLRSPHAYARVKSISFEQGAGRAGSTGCDRPGRGEHAHGRAGLPGTAGRGDRSRNVRSGTRSARARRRRLGGARAARRSRRGRSAAASSWASRAATSAATWTRRSRRRTSSSRRSSARRPCCTARWRPISRSASGAATRSTSTSRPSSSGACATRSRRSSSLAPDKVRVVCEFMGGGFGSKNGAGDHTYIAAELAKRTGRPGALHAHSPGGEPRGRQPQLDDPAADRRRALGRDARRAGRRVRERNGLGRLGGPHRRPDADALRLRERPHGALARRRSTRPR